MSSQSSYQDIFNQASVQNNIPEGLLQSIAQTTTRITHLDENQLPSCAGLPMHFGVMGLVENGNGYHRNNLLLCSEKSGFSTDELKKSPQQNINAFAKALAKIADELNIDRSKIENYTPAIIALSEFPSNNMVNDYAINSYLYSIFTWLGDEAFAQEQNFEPIRANLEGLFGKENLKILQSTKVILDKNGVHNKTNSYIPEYKFSMVCNDYAPALQVPTDCYNSRAGTPISAVTIHTMQGYYSGSISWFMNCANNVSSHYLLRSSDGQITQMVCEADRAWHVGSENSYTIGLEHEGFVDNIAWYTEEMYTSSADLIRDICDSGYGILPHRTYYHAASSGVQVLGACTQIKGHQHFPNNSHTDPGINWDWEYYYRLINDPYSNTTISSLNGDIYDSGGSGGNYSSDERLTWLINLGVSFDLIFSQFSIEDGWDYIWIYDGSDNNGSLIGQYTGTNSPGIIHSNTGSLFIEFRSDCSVTDIGWAASWSAGVLGCMDSSACNYNSMATMDDGSCTFTGCTDSSACNFDSIAGCDDSSCVYGNCLCQGDFNGDNTIDISDLLIFLGEYGCETSCLTDLSGDGNVDANDMLVFLSFFASLCP